MKLLLITAWLALAAAAPVRAAATHSLEATVVAIADGDTITVLDAGRSQHRVRLAGIDAPEKGQAFGEQARQALSDRVFGRQVTLEWSKSDRYGRLVATVWTAPPEDCRPPCPTRMDVNLAQVSAGLAWHYRHFEKEQAKAAREAYAAAEARARSSGLGLWSQPDPVAPWDWRRGTQDSTGTSPGPVRKSRNGICHAPGSSGWGTVRRYMVFETMEACVASGGRPPRG